MKGISPLLAATLLVAVTVGIGTLIAGFVSTTFQSTQVTITNKSTEATNCASAEIVVDDVYSKVGDNGTTVAVLRNSGFADDLTITSAQLYDKLGNNFSASNMPVTDFDKGELTTLIFQMPKFANTTADSSSSGNTGNCTNMGPGGANNTCSFALLGKSGSAMNFDGMNDYVNVSDSAIFDNIFLEGTITAWIRLTRNVSVEQIFFSQTPRIELISENDDLRLFVHGYTDRYVMNDSITRTGVWYHVAATWSNSTNFSTGYVNGIMGTNFSYSNQTLNLGSDIHIGARDNTQEQFNGTIDEVSFWNRSLSGLEVNSTMISGVNSTNTSGLVGYWRFDEGKGVIVCSDFSKLIATTNCGGISATFDRLPTCS